MSTNLSPEITQLIAHELALGRYGSEEEVLSEAVKLLSQRNSLRERIAAGMRQLEAGEYTDYDPQALRRRLDNLKAGKPLQAQREDLWA